MRLKMLRSVQHWVHMLSWRNIVEF